MSLYPEGILNSAAIYSVSWSFWRSQYDFKEALGSVNPCCDVCLSWQKAWTLWRYVENPSTSMCLFWCATFDNLNNCINGISRNVRMKSSDDNRWGCGICCEMISYIGAMLEFGTKITFCDFNLSKFWVAFSSSLLLKGLILFKTSLNYFCRTHD